MHGWIDRWIDAERWMQSGCNDREKRMRRMDVERRCKGGWLATFGDLWMRTVGEK